MVFYYSDEDEEDEELASDEDACGVSDGREEEEEEEEEEDKGLDEKRRRKEEKDAVKEEPQIRGRISFGSAGGVASEGQVRLFESTRLAVRCDAARCGRCATFSFRTRRLQDENCP